MEYYSAIKKNEVLIHAATWMTFENLCKVSQTQNDKFCMILLYEISRIGKFT